MAIPETGDARESIDDHESGDDVGTGDGPAGDDGRTVGAAAVLGLFLLALAAVTLFDAASLSRAGAGPLGPAVFPGLIGTLLAVAGVTMLVRSLRQWPSAPGPAGVPAGRLLRLAALVVLLVIFAVVLPIVGYVASSTALFAGAAFLLGSPHPWRGIAYGWTLAAVVFVVFDRVIGLSLPAGPWGF
ncbi:putative tricarboxylic transport membrane protein [Saccharopolyspora lacisalsi]|uniref:Putative tricarboxylic transport membrane protein n=1 Tax=Halosaccharopolyspora lacisalsi TaxID=1000566 RepID=A0A839DWT8_9PSEU|nr:tripartite tricarboxylate transporter TctB family protein [Halosaccharopolyspora lacisalsi]MBA8826432.1 putative tricarboxylic transport membrane protein [Halosaccharopolyspora lacisalsi]